MERFAPRAWRTTFTVEVKAANGTLLKLRCIPADTLIGCLAWTDKAPAVIHLMLQEPGLRIAHSDAERQAIVETGEYYEMGEASLDRILAPACQIPGPCPSAG